jgi:hypothetical protein
VLGVGCVIRLALLALGVTPRSIRNLNGMSSASQQPNDVSRENATRTSRSAEFAAGQVEIAGEMS